MAIIAFVMVLLLVLLTCPVWVGFATESTELFSGERHMCGDVLSERTFYQFAAGDTEYVDPDGQSSSRNGEADENTSDSSAVIVEKPIPQAAPFQQQQHESINSVLVGIELFLTLFACAVMLSAMGQISRFPLRNNPKASKFFRRVTHSVYLWGLTAMGIGILAPVVMVSTHNILIEHVAFRFDDFSLLLLCLGAIQMFAVSRLLRTRRHARYTAT